MKDEPDINEFLAKHSKDATHFISAPETLEQIIKAGLKLTAFRYSVEMSSSWAIPLIATICAPNSSGMRHQV